MVSMTTPGILSQLNKTCIELIKQKKSFDSLKDILQKYESQEPAFINYLFAFFLAENERYLDADEYIQKSLRFLYEDTSSISPSMRDFRERVCFLVAEIYANIQKEEESAIWFKKYVILKLSPLVEESRPLKLLSFRRFNEFSLLDLINNEVTLCNPSVLNDPFDTLITKWTENYKVQAKNKKHLKIYFDALNSIRVRSFASIEEENENSMVQNKLMWSHYAGEHNGFCIKYNFSENFVTKLSKSSAVFFHKIIYNDFNDPIDLTSDTIDMEDALITKEKYWQYENEVRLIYYDESSKTNDFVQVSLGEDAKIEAVYFGYRCSDRNIRTIMKILSSNKDVKYFKMKADYKDIYNLYPDEISK